MADVPEDTAALKPTADVSDASDVDVADVADSPVTSLPPTPTPQPKANSDPGFIPLVTVVDFHHARGPEVETWFGAAEGSDPAVEYDWPLLPFMALSDGAHA